MWTGHFGYTKMYMMRSLLHESIMTLISAFEDFEAQGQVSAQNLGSFTAVKL